MQRARILSLPIISFSLPDELLESLDKLKHTGRYVGRSDLVRASIRLMIDDARVKEVKKGEVNAVLIATHDRLADESIRKLKHDNEDVVKTHIHRQIDQDTCLELLLLCGDGKKIGSMTRVLQRDPKMKSARIVTL